MPRLSSLMLCVTVSCALAQASPGIVVQQNNVMLNYAPFTGFSVRVESQLAADFPRTARLVQAEFVCDGIEVSNMTRADSSDVAAWRKQFVQGNSLVIGATRVTCSNNRINIRTGSQAALRARFEPFQPEDLLVLKARNSLPALAISPDGVNLLGFVFVFEKGKVTTTNQGGQMAVTQGSKPRPVLFDGKLTPVPLNDKRPYTLHTSVLGSKVWSNLRVDPASGTVTVWSSTRPQP